MKTQILFFALLACLFAFPAFADQEAATPATDQELVESSEAVEAPATEEGHACVEQKSLEQLFGLMGFIEQNSGVQPVSAECRAGCWIAFRACLRACNPSNTACINGCIDDKDDCDGGCNGSPGTCFPGTPQWPDCVTTI